MLDYKDILLKHYALHMTGSEIARQLGVSKSGVNGFLQAFEACDKLLFPLPEGITNYGIAELVYGKHPGSNVRDVSYELPDFQEVARQMRDRKNMTLVFLWNRYAGAARPRARSSTSIASSVSVMLHGARKT